MEFRFDLKPIFSQPIAKINHYLLPHTFKGDRRTALDVSTKISEIVNKLGEHSAQAQGLSKSVTTSQKLRMAENQRLYLLVDTESGHNGAVVGLLKVGIKSLYVFDESGATQHVDAPCILDFYIHDSRQRSGLGRDLFETMLAEEQWVPKKLAVDRPSEKLLGFMRKHYGLRNAIPQSNNFVIYEGFFDKPSENNNQNGNGLHITDSPNTAFFGPHFVGGDNKRRLRHQSPSPQISQNSPVGRYAAPRPSCSMAEVNKRQSEISLTPSKMSTKSKVSHAGSVVQKNPLDALSRTSIRSKPAEKRSGLSDERLHARFAQCATLYENSVETTKTIIHNNSKSATGEPNRSRRDTIGDYIQSEYDLDSVQGDFANLNVEDEPEPEVEQEPEPEPEVVVEVAIQPEVETQSQSEANADDVEPQHIKRPSNFQLNKQHTGLKNISFNVGMAVTPTSKMEFDQEQAEEFGVVKINRPPGKLLSPQPDVTDAVSTVSSGEGYTDQGYYDLKFHHNKLW